MRLKTKLVLSAMGVTFAMVLVLSLLFLGELLRQRISQTALDNEVLAHEVLLMTRQAIETGLREQPPVDRSEEALQAAVVDALRSHDPLADTMNAIIRYSPTVQDVSVTNAHGLTLVSSDPDALDQPAATRTKLASVRDGSIWYQGREMFGSPHVLDIALPLDRNGRPFLVVHMGVRSSFLRAAYLPWLHAGLWFALGAALLSMLAAALLANAALRPIKRISEQLERLAKQDQEEIPQPQLKAQRNNSDAVIRVNRTIDRLGHQIRSTEAEYTALQANLNQMLDTLRDGVLLFTGDLRAVMVSDAVAHFINRHEEVLVGKSLEEIFAPDTVLGAAVFSAFTRETPIAVQTITLEDGRRIQLSVDRIGADRENGGEMATLLTLRDIESAIKLEQELEVSRRLVAIGRLTAGVGHEVKNPINAMVLHLELLRSKLYGKGEEAFGGAQRHVEILAGEMQRLDRVVQTLADFTRPMELHLGEHDLRRVLGTVVELTGAEMIENGVHVEFNVPVMPLMVRVDADLISQAVLNLLLNAMQAMPHGGKIHLLVRREGRSAIVEVVDDGEGIPAELLPRIFELYFTTKPEGSGIGLAMTYRILQMHGGAMEVRSSTSSIPESAPRGTTFTLRLPIASPVAGANVDEDTRMKSTPIQLERRV
ncbi:ATP-binding protein [Granulicella arctica]|uniref:histidine kinase n=1 Tax=Granulicella arctica TaxID=940613 RepID=A0A7Y9PIV8_9BACT|nr:ATP-binding protein [Granulicella arctica]NYF80719.1 signal transduction histidine kinase [Granulicella arctica]